MKRTILLLLIVILLVFAGVFLVALWLDMQSSEQQGQHHSRHSSSEPEGRDRGSQQDRSERNGRERQPRGDRSVQSTCALPGVTCSSVYFADWKWPADQSCNTKLRNGYPEPDARCTPGGVVPGVTAETLRDPAWRTKCIRNCQSTEIQKHVTYKWYGLPSPEHNSGQTQVCELDHLVPLELGGADGLGNIWPQCGPTDAVLRARYFKQKDIVENYLAAKVKAGEMTLDAAQRGIASDWVQYLPTARDRIQDGEER